MTTLLEHHVEYIKHLVEKGGPDPEDYYDLDAWISELSERTFQGKLPEENRNELIQILGEALSCNTMQGFAFQKPHGYAGDYEIIDRIYTHWTSPNPQLRKWDEYFHKQVAPQAVRNRKDYFLNTLKELPCGGGHPQCGQRSGTGCL